MIQSDPVCLVIPGPPRTKKNHNRLVKQGSRRIMLPSEPWVTWRDYVYIQNLKQRPEFRYPKLAGRPYNCRATFYREAKVGDAVGYYQGLADVLQYLEVVPDDRWIVSWDGSRLEKDADRPRVELTLTVVR